MATINGTWTRAGAATFGYSMRVEPATTSALVRLLLVAPAAAMVPLVVALADDPRLPPDPRLSVALAALLAGLVLTVFAPRRGIASHHVATLPSWPAALAGLLLWTAAIALANSALPAGLGWYGMTLAIPPVVAAFIGRAGLAAVVTGAAVVGFAASAEAAHQHGPGSTGAVFGFAAYTVAGVVVAHLAARAIARDHEERTSLALVATATARAATIEEGLADVAAILVRGPLAGCRPTEVRVTRHVGARPARLGLATLTWHDDETAIDEAATLAVDDDGVGLDGHRARVVTGADGPTTYALDLELAQPLTGDGRRTGRAHLAGVAVLVHALVERVRALDELEQIGHTDELTGLPTRRTVLSRLEVEQAEIPVDGSLSVALVALDDVDTYHERFGTPERNRLIADLGTMLRTRVRGNDLVARHDLASFCLVLPSTGARGAVRLVDELHTWAALLRPGQPVTFSAGIADWDGDESVRSLLARGERALRTAQREGQDRTVVAAGGAGADDLSDPAPTR